MQKYFLALLILAQKTNTGQQGVPAMRPAHIQSNIECIEMPLMTLKGSTEATCLNDGHITSSTLQVVLSVPAD